MTPDEYCKRLNSMSYDYTAFEAGKAARDAELARQEPVAWHFQNGETGLCTSLTNDGINHPENFVANNPRFSLIGPLYTHPRPPPDVQELVEALRYCRNLIGASRIKGSDQTLRMADAALTKHRGQS